MKGRPYDVITFDCYGTLVDWEGGITRAFAEAAANDGLVVDSQTVLAAHAEIEPRIQATGYQSYREVLRQTAILVAERLGWSVSYERAAFLADSLPTWEPFEDSNPAHAHFVEARRRIGDGRWLHAAQSHFHDVVPACRLGIPVAWINRKAETAPGDALPDQEMRTMADLADWLT